jgi:VWFA-related protein
MTIRVAARWPAVATAFGAAVALVSGAQQPAPVFRSGAELIEVDAIVTDRDGNPVRDLTAADFEVFEDGRPQTIQTFRLVDLPYETASPGVKTASDVEPGVATNTGDEGRIYVLLLDSPSTGRLLFATTGLTYNARVKRIAHQFIDEVVQPGDQVAVVNVQGDFTDSQPFTSSKRLLSAAVERYGRGPSGDLSPNDDMTGQEKVVRHLQTNRTMLDVAQRLGAAAARRKAIIWIGGQVTVNTEQYMRASRATPTDSATAALMASYRDAIREAARNNVAVYPVDAHGLSVSFGDISTRLASNEQLLRLAGFRQYAEDTGGRAVVNTNSFREGFAAIARETSTYYLMGYSPDQELSAEPFRRIEVRVARPGVTVRARRGYYGVEGAARESPVADTLPQGVSADLARALRSPLPVRGLGLDVFAAPFRDVNRQGTIVFGAHVIGSGLRVEAGERLAVAYLLLDIEGKIVSSRSTVFGLDLTGRGHDVARDGGFSFVDAVALPKGRYELRLAAEQPGRAVGSVVTYVVVPPDDEEFALSGIVLAADGVREVPLADGPRRAGVLSVNPTALRRFRGQGTLVAFAQVYGRSLDAADLAVTARLATASGDDVARADPRMVLDDNNGDRGRRLTFRAEFELGALPPGRYVLRVEGRTTGRRGRMASRQVPFSVE